MRTNGAAFSRRGARDHTVYFQKLEISDFKRGAGEWGKGRKGTEKRGRRGRKAEGLAVLAPRFFAVCCVFKKIKNIVLFVCDNSCRAADSPTAEIGTLKNIKII